MKKYSYLYQIFALSVISIDQIFICLNIFQNNYLPFLFWSSIVPVFIFSFFTKNNLLVMGPSIPIMILLSQLLVYFFNSLDYLIYIPFFTTFFLAFFLFYKPANSFLQFPKEFLTWFIVAVSLSILYQQFIKQFDYMEDIWWYVYFGILIFSLLIKKLINPLITMLVCFVILQYFHPNAMVNETFVFEFKKLAIIDLPYLLIISFFVSVFIIFDFQALTEKDFSKKEKSIFLFSHLISIIPSAPSVVKTTFNKEIKGNYFVILGSLPLLFLFFWFDLRLHSFALSMMIIYVFTGFILKKYNTLKVDLIYIIFATLVFFKFFIFALILLFCNQLYTKYKLRYTSK